MRCEMNQSNSARASLSREIIQAVNILIKSPSNYKPLALCTILLLLQSFGGESYINKNMIQILNSGEKFDGEFSATTNLTQSTFSNSDKDIKTDANQLAILIQGAKLPVIMTMTILIKRLRVRFLYFTSLIFTAMVLLILGLISSHNVFFFTDSICVIKTVFLCIHVVFLQFGLQTLPSLLMDVLYPASSRAMLKGLSISVGNVFLIFLICILNMFSFQQAFFILFSLVFITIPLLYIFLPEIRNITTETCAEFFIPFQTVFYFPIPRHKASDTAEAGKDLKSWTKNTFEIHCAMALPEVKINREIPIISTISEQNRYEALNQQRVYFVSNILGQNGFLTKNQDKNRVMIGRGIVKFKSSALMKSGSIFLFSDVLIVAKCVLIGRRYVAETCFNIHSHVFSLQVEGAEMILIKENNSKERLEFENPCLAQTWETYIKFVRSRSELGPLFDCQNFCSEEPLVWNGQCAIN